MSLRHTTHRRDGKVHTYWRLVRSMRNGRRVVQQTVAQLGERDAQGRARAKAQALAGRGTQTALVTPEAAENVVVPVRLDRVRPERDRRFGDVWLGWTLWQALRLDTRLTTLLSAGREAVPWAIQAAVWVLACLCEPASAVHSAEDWYGRLRWGSARRVDERGPGRPALSSLGWLAAPHTDERAPSRMLKKCAGFVGVPIALVAQWV